MCLQELAGIQRERQEVRQEPFPNFGKPLQLDFHNLVLEMQCVGETADPTCTDFDLQLAYVCACASTLTYAVSTRFELATSRRVRLLLGSSGVFQSRILRAEDGAWPDWLRAAEGFLIETLHVLAMGFVIYRDRQPHFVVVAARGTANSRDLLEVDLDLGRHHAQTKNGHAAFHAGFYRAVAECGAEVSIRLSRHAPRGVPVLLAGHSLGGAMAAIINAQPGLVGDVNREWIRSCYAFGMPRFGDRIASQSCMALHRVVYRNGALGRDCVPMVPPGWMGFHPAGSLTHLKGKGLEACIRGCPRPTGTKGCLHWRWDVLGRWHCMERYLVGLRELMPGAPPSAWQLAPRAPLKG